MNVRADGFVSWYRDEIMPSYDNAEKLVLSNPEFALRVFNVFKDRVVGDLFVKHYFHNPNYHESALFVKKDMNRRKLLLKRAIQDKEDNSFHPSPWKSNYRFSMRDVIEDLDYKTIRARNFLDQAARNMEDTTDEV